MGGIAIYAGVLVALLIAMPFSEWVKLKYFFIGTSLMFFIGLRDDILGLTPIKKLIGQLLPILIIVIFGKLSFGSSILGIPSISFPGWVIFLLVISAFVLTTNAYNLIDGLDGLAGVTGVIVLSFFGLWFFFAGESYLSLIALSVVGSILAFLKFNWQPSKIFMGDTGALLIGFIISFFAITFLEVNENIGDDFNIPFSSSIGTLCCVLIIPVFDTSRVVIFRLRKGLSPFKADRNHIHHQFLKLGYNHAQSVVRIGAINIAFVVLAILLRKQSDLVLIPLVVVLCLLINFALKWRQKNAGTNTKAV
ncbi:MAG: undecaprenyl/decaprenyl-phosphate alpha-N-acetylglucosaminyl 1-phosphate transferase [Cyclobacteriaceae bacterium]|nr:undecaprenyl/decaprenyl-phosphate alpha-N-acetylglucosaminyl 1-phosphate transferase [Cyclobacteriaceae bacterium]